VRHFLAHIADYQPLPRPVPAAEFDPRPNVQMSISEIGEDAYRELLRRGGAARATLRGQEQSGSRGQGRSSCSAYPPDEISASRRG
jgi:hypothetical protein